MAARGVVVARRVGEQGQGTARGVVVAVGVAPDCADDASPEQARSFITINIFRTF